ncbi:hypothetical protein ACFSBZ_12605 [Amnibacterium flavum]|uniref:Uncharacterized protein n=1 Tax=Amnibacterium flavum TaxID=2173173 RepID=A0A2V1HV71_9MICO|nr:hypothetical protein [Amnibacterium flavum]PVZ95622.1 hypothetical protein DDQ50_03815 [Amnibacterium flavum]
MTATEAVPPAPAPLRAQYKVDSVSGWLTMTSGLRRRGPRRTRKGSPVSAVQIDPKTGRVADFD